MLYTYVCVYLHKTRNGTYRNQLNRNEINKEHKRTLYIPLTLINNFMFCFISYSAFNELALV